jgi:hypothetical protein
MSPLQALLILSISFLSIKSIGGIDRRSNNDFMPISDRRDLVFTPTPLKVHIL